MGIVSVDSFLNMIDKKDFRRAFGYFFNDNVLYSEIFQREGYIWQEGDYPIVDKYFNLVFFSKSMHETVAFVLGAYQMGIPYELPNICRGNTHGADYFLRNWGYYRTSGEGKRWYITNSLNERLDDIDRLILKNQPIRQLNF